jgi:ATP adenylyltransferase
MKVLYAPWRADYSKDTDNPTRNEHADSQHCVFCTQLHAQQDAHYYIIRRFSHVALMLNKFPYNAGHLLIVPFAHTGSLEGLSIQARTELIELATQASSLVQTGLGAQGVNVGINMGKAAGAGIPAHIHLHVLPRWPNDTNFMATLGHTKVISYDLDEVYYTLKPLVENITITV